MTGRDDASRLGASGNNTAPPLVIDGPEAVHAAVGTRLGTSRWLEIDQARVDLFADATGDHQWIHVDPARAADGPYGGTIAHGYLTLALTNLLLPEVVEIRGFSAGVNYGVDRVRFPAAVPVGAHVRAVVDLTAAEVVASGVQTTMRIAMECDRTDRPVCVVDAISRWLT
jgi:acyl dehydratase